MRVLVTGGAGFIGSHVVDRCIAAGHDVVVVDNLSTGNRQSVPPAARLAVMDIRSPDLADVFRDEQPDAVIHLAAQAEVRRSVENPLLDADVNIMGSVNLLECSRRFGVRQVIYSSSGGAVYGDTDVLPTPEDQPAHPASPYGVSKLAVEHYLGCWAGLYGIRRGRSALRERVRSAPEPAGRSRRRGDLRAPAARRRARRHQRRRPADPRLRVRRRRRPRPTSWPSSTATRADPSISARESRRPWSSSSSSSAQRSG